MPKFWCQEQATCPGHWIASVNESCFDALFNVQKPFVWPSKKVGSFITFCVIAWNRLVNQPGLEVSNRTFECPLNETNVLSIVTPKLTERSRLHFPWLGNWGYKRLTFKWQHEKSSAKLILKKKWMCICMEIGWDPRAHGKLKTRLDKAIESLATGKNPVLRVKEEVRWNKLRS